MWPLRHLSPPPIPRRIKEYLADYPELLEDLQRSLDNVVLKPSQATPPFEVAIWALEDGLDGFKIDAGEELSTAKAVGDGAAITRAEKKELATRLARSSACGMRDLNELYRYFEESGRALGRWRTTLAPPSQDM